MKSNLKQLHKVQNIGVPTVYFMKSISILNIFIKIYELDEFNYLSKYPFHEMSDFTMWMKYMHFKNKKGCYRLSTKNNCIILKTNQKFKILLFLFKPPYQH